MSRGTDPVDHNTQQPQVLTEKDIAQGTFRYVRLAVVAAMGMLAVSIALEAAKVGVLRSSISSYYWTPANAVLVAALVAGGICLVAIQGSTATEDLLLNLAGALAPIVAFVPIRNPGEASSAPSVPVNFAANVENNVLAYLVAGLATAVVTWWIVVRSGLGSLTTGQRVGFGLLVAGVVGGVAWFGVDREGFERHAHVVSAVSMFVILLAVMVVNAVSYGRLPHVSGVRGHAMINRYLIIAGLTAVLAAVAGIAWLLDAQGALFWLEAVVLVGFVAFWIIQTRELWPTPAGVRADPRGVMPPAPADGEPAR